MTLSIFPLNPACPANQSFETKEFPSALGGLAFSLSSEGYSSGVAPADGTGACPVAPKDGTGVQ